MYDYDQAPDDSYDDYDDERDMCDRCGNSGRIPSPDYLSIQGIAYLACPVCEHGLNSGLPWDG